VTAHFTTITGETWRRSLIAARQRFAGTTERIRSQIPANHLMPRTTAQQINDLLCRQGATGVSADDIMKIVQPIEARADRLADALRPFANYACEPKEGNCDCHNCAARSALSDQPAQTTTNEDTARLDWMEETRSCALALCGDDNNGNPTRHVWEVGNVDPSKYRDTLRAAIDASRKASA
jgi:hypothetical protein